MTFTQSETILIKNSLNMMRTYIKELNMNNDKLLSSSREYKEIDNILNKLEEEVNNEDEEISYIDSLLTTGI